MLFHDSNDIHFILFCFLPFFPRFFFLLSSKSLYEVLILHGNFIMHLLHATLVYSYLWKAVRSISAKLAITFCLPSLYLLIRFLIEIPMCELTNPTHYTYPHCIYGGQKKTIEWHFRFAIEISEILTIHIISNVSHY